MTAHYLDSIFCGGGDRVSQTKPCNLQRPTSKKKNNDLCQNRKIKKAKKQLWISNRDIMRKMMRGRACYASSLYWINTSLPHSHVPTTRRRQQQWITLICSHGERNKKGKEDINKCAGQRWREEKKKRKKKSHWARSVKQKMFAETTFYVITTRLFVRVYTVNIRAVCRLQSL